MIITDEAKAYIEEMMKEAETTTLRFFNAGAGCCGPSYQLTLDKAQENDIVERINHIEVAFDPTIADLVRNVILDIDLDEEGPALIVSGGSSSCC
ncbi:MULTISPECIES: adhesin [Paenibacillus]|jgi:Fe-S cluster assembly iron-binding protein IscA|uniref:Adhesin n=1 Tax=Paenibacillus glucanolyticus TaxID=59843 RepID=A0A168EVD8_9BACL|nr:MULTISPECIES: adhesin [Paenibacillus]MCA4754191.1 adhesin [Mycolicibacterium fortuitum]ETT40444.1 putative iron binding protein from the HesB_IscA_SufA family [Paenibacillus sp. FSL R5-808]KZS44867.1 adhesin [Paenibacillus glucanolyticus]MCT1403096.1 adhesin [Paenibacillus sp. p3-SID867]MDH6675084.1 Fe-S cluster assembly iron-binding protein IscA [Paenibacillus sp. LBL]